MAATEPCTPEWISKTVHYVSRSPGTPVKGGGSPAPLSECRAAIITKLPTDDGWDRLVGLAVLSPDGLTFSRAVGYHDGAETPGDPECQQAHTHGNPFRYCACGWAEATLPDDTWHWPHDHK